MNIPTANIVVAFNKETMERLFSAGATYKSLVAELSEGDQEALLFDNVANPNFISFEHSLGLGTSMKMVLSFIDPKDEFESRFFTQNPVRLVKGFSNPRVEKTEGFVTTKPDDVRQSQEKYSLEYAAQLKQELDKHIGERDIFVAYGAGNNLNSWSGPHRTKLMNAEIDVKGSKKITLTMVPTSNALDIGTRRGSFKEKANLNLQGLKLRFVGQSQEIKFNNYFEGKAYDPTEYLDVGNKSLFQSYSDEITKALADNGFEELSFQLQTFDFHTMVVDAIRSYVQNATNNKNVVVLLPNLNVICRQAINDQAAKFKVIKIDASSVPLTAAAATAAAGPGMGAIAFSQAESNYLKSQTQVGKTEMFVESALKSFGLRMHTADREQMATLQKKAEPSRELGKYSSYEKYPKYSDAIEAYYDKRYFTAVIDKTDRQVPDHMGVLQTIFDKIKKLAAESYKMSTLGVLEETDTEVLKLWCKTDGIPWSKFYTFGGYDTLSDSDSTIVVGDLALIKEFLYGGIDIEAQNKTYDDLKTKSLKSKTKEVQDPEEPTAEDYAFAAATVFPLHPLDRLLFSNKEYNKKIREIVYPVVREGAFGDINYIPDDFAYKDESFTDKEKEYIEENGIPVFRYNTQNPNVLDMKFKFGGIYFTLLKAGYQKEISRLSSGVVEGVLPTGIGTFPIRSRGAAIAYLRSKGYAQGLGDENKKDILQSLANKISPDLAEDMEVDSTERAADSFATYIKDSEEGNLKGLILVEQELPGNPNAIIADLSESLYRKALNMTITTLPSFHISRTSTMHSPCIVFAQDQPITQTTRGQRKLLNKFFSGLYKIMGFKHTITSKNASSEFSLVKNAPKFKDEQ